MELLALGKKSALSSSSSHCYSLHARVAHDRLHPSYPHPRPFSTLMHVIGRSSGAASFWGQNMTIFEAKYT